MGYKYLDYPGKSRRPSSKAIGKKLGLAERTVRLRIKRMEREGFIQYYAAIPNLSLFGLPIACLFSFQVDDIRKKQHALQQLKKTDHVIEIADMIGGNFGATIAVSSEQDVEQVTHKLTELTHTSKVVHSSNRWFTSPRFSLDKLDWRLIKALQYDALRSTKEIATELGVSNRMTDYRINRLLESRAVVIRAVISARDRQGILFYNLTLSLDPGMKEKIMNVVSERFKSEIFLVLTPPGPLLALGLFATSIGEAEDNLLDSLSIPGVKTGNLSFFKNDVALQRPSWIDKFVEKKILSA
ncbi:MAG: AsnC family transcriptional regulator [Nitrososphaerales archaeon]